MLKAILASGGRRFMRRLALMAGAALVATALLACGGEKGPANDPARADTAAHAALIGPADLPGAGWVITGRDQFQDGSRVDVASDSKACDSARAKSELAKKTAAEDRAGRAQLVLEIPASTQAPLATTIEQTVSVQNTTAATAKAMDAFRDLMQSGDMGQCVADSVTRSFAGAPGAKVTSAPGSPAKAAPSNGTASAFDVVITVQGQTLEMRLESYIWQDENAGVTLSISGPKNAITPELVGRALEAAAAKLKAQRGDG